MKNGLEIKLLNKRIKKLDDPDFDLEAWKSGTLSALERAVADASTYQKGIEGLRIDYSSWALRDATSKYNPTETCKKKAKEILETAIEELELFGEGKKKKPKSGKKLSANLPDDIRDAIDKKDMKRLATILKRMKKSEMESMVLELLIN